VYDETETAINLSSWRVVLGFEIQPVKGRAAVPLDVDFLTDHADIQSVSRGL
jgi:hypothetical protein